MILSAADFAYTSGNMMLDEDSMNYRPRSMLTDEQKRLLEEQYSRDPWPSRYVTDCVPLFV